MAHILLMVFSALPGNTAGKFKGLWGKPHFFNGNCLSVFFLNSSFTFWIFLGNNTQLSILLTSKLGITQHDTSKKISPEKVLIIWCITCFSNREHNTNLELYPGNQLQLSAGTLWGMPALESRWSALVHMWLPDFALLRVQTWDDLGLDCVSVSCTHANFGHVSADGICPGLADSGGPLVSG